jgi:hypothetical protein
MNEVVPSNLHELSVMCVFIDIEGNIAEGDERLHLLRAHYAICECRLLAAVACNNARGLTIQELTNAINSDSDSNISTISISTCRNRGSNNKKLEGR